MGNDSFLNYLNYLFFKAIFWNDLKNEYSLTK